MQIESKKFCGGQSTGNTNFKKRNRKQVIKEKDHAIKTKRTEIIYEHKYAPCTILERRSKCSYLVDMGNECLAFFSNASVTTLVL